jgi:hypothetical protein
VALTPLTASTPYLTATRLLDYIDEEIVKDLLRTGDAPRPTRLAVLDSTTVEGARLLRILLAVSGRIEGECLVGNRYRPVDLAALTGAGLARLEDIHARLVHLALAGGKQPNAASVRNVPGAEDALKALELLRGGQAIFSLTEAGDAGLPATTTPDANLFMDGNGAIPAASRLFGSHGRPRR